MPHSWKASKLMVFFQKAEPKRSTGNCFLVFFVWISVSISNNSSIVPKPPGKATRALAR